MKVLRLSFVICLVFLSLSFASEKPVKQKFLTLSHSEKYSWLYDHDDINVEKDDKGVALYFFLPAKDLKEILTSRKLVNINVSLDKNDDWRLIEMIGYIGKYPNLKDDNNLKLPLFPWQNEEKASDFYFRGMWGNLEEGDYTVKILVYKNNQKDVTKEDIKKLEKMIKVFATY